jgi:hypothetical protein
VTDADREGRTIVWNGVVGSVEDAEGSVRSGGSGLDGLSAVRGDRQWPDLREPGSRKPDAELEQPDRAHDERGAGELGAGEALAERDGREEEPCGHLDRHEE